MVRHCCHQLQLHSATIIVYSFGVSMHNVPADMGLQVLVASRSATRCHVLMHASDSDIQGASQAKISEVSKVMDCKSGSKAAGKSLQARVTRSQRVRV